jgi:hypothetical protein
VLVAVFACTAFIDWWLTRGKHESANKKRLALYALVLISAVTVYGVMRWNAANTSHHPTLDDRPIACLGDSLTDYGYPQELAKLISVPVADFGVDGIKTDDGIKMIPKILAANPQLVVIELGDMTTTATTSPDRRPKRTWPNSSKRFKLGTSPWFLWKFPVDSSVMPMMAWNVNSRPSTTYN